MNPRKHLLLLRQASVVWLVFWLAGLPHYFQQYSMLTMAVVCTFLSVLFCLYAVYVLVRCREEVRYSRAFWLSFYYTVPFALYDTLYCGWCLGLGAGFLVSHWYLTVFYFSIWVTFLPVAWLLGAGAPKKAGVV